MFKLVVLCAFFAAAAAEPGVFLTPYTSYSSVVAPATTTITKQASSVVHPSPVVYSTPFAYTHFIKKRSPQLVPYVAPTTLIHKTSVVTPFFQHAAILPAVAPITYTSAHVPYAAHLIKKRSAPLFHATKVVAPITYAANPFFPYTYTSTPVFPAPIISTPVAYSAAHFIKKRSAPLFHTTNIITPTTYATAPIYTHSYAAATPVFSTPIISTPYAYSTAHFIKKRSAPLLHSNYVIPTTYAAPLVAHSYAATTPVFSTPYISTPITYAAAHFIKK